MIAYDVDEMMLISLMLERARKEGLSCEVIRHFYQYSFSGCSLVDSINCALTDLNLEPIQ